MLSPLRTLETDGLGAALMPVVCAWCRQPMGAKVCEAAMAGMVSHGICPGCVAIERAKLNLNDAPSAPARMQRPETGAAGSPGVVTRQQSDEHARVRPGASFTFNDGVLA